MHDGGGEPLALEQLDDVLGVELGLDLVLMQDRITSYNVCYTKLLRDNWSYRAVVAVARLYQDDVLTQ